MARGGIPASPLPQRRGVDAMRLRMPQEGPWLTLRDHLVDRIPALDPERIDAMLAAGEFVGIDGMPCAPDAPFVPRSVVWVHRDLPDEVPVPFEVEVLHQDERIVVVDKPPFLATMPRGMHVTETVVTRLREQIGLPRLTPAHRLDRLTSGVLLLTTEQRWRGAYQQVFARGAAHKEYLAAAPVDPTLELPRRVAVHVDKPHGQWQAMVLPDRGANAVTDIELLRVATGSDGIPVGLYRLIPHTGRTHQLRATMSWLGLPIVGDPLYPLVVDVADDDFSTPLGLLAQVLSFPDPVDGEPRRFVSRRQPPGWPGTLRPRAEQELGQKQPPRPT